MRANSTSSKLNPRIKFDASGKSVSRTLIGTPYAEDRVATFTPFTLFLPGDQP
jgi:hypothetical protein